MSKMNPEIKKVWVDRLRSGKDRQGTGYLKQQYGEQDTPAYCCLGVLCEIAIESGLGIDVRQPDEETVWAEYDDNYEVLPESVQKWAGLEMDNPELPDPDTDFPMTTSIADLNDNGKTFAELADIIEKEF